MPDKELLEEYPLYRNHDFKVPGRLGELDKPAIHMLCRVCESDQTFRMVNDYWEGYGSPEYDARGAVARLRYRCTSCEKCVRHFLVKLDLSGERIMKVGQFPAWNIAGDKNVEQLLGEHASLFKRGLICESQGYGIGSFAYYRRIVDEVIDELLGQISDLLSEAELESYNAVLEQTKKTKITSDKIKLTKDLLPPILRPDGMNPLAALHEVLSEGLHAETDDRCLELAMEVREVLIYLASQVAASRSAGKSYSTSMKKLLARDRGGTA